MDRSDQPPTDLHSPDAPAALDGAYVEAIAQHVAKLIRDDAREEARNRLVDAATLASELGVERSWVYEHANELRPIRLGTGPKARLRFNVLTVRIVLTAQHIVERRSSLSVNGADGRAAARRHARRSGTPKPTVGRVLAVRPRDAS